MWTRSIAGRRRSDRKVVHGYFQAAAPGARVIGTVAVPLSGSNLREIVPHEVSHAVIHHLQGVSARDDEAAASAIGLFCAAIFPGSRRSPPFRRPHEQI